MFIVSECQLFARFYSDSDSNSLNKTKKDLSGCEEDIEKKHPQTYQLNKDSSADDSLREERECEDGIFERLVLEQSWRRRKAML